MFVIRNYFLKKKEKNLDEYLTKWIKPLSN